MQVTMETWRMGEQWTPGTLFSPPHGTGNQAKLTLALILKRKPGNKPKH